MITKIVFNRIIKLLIKQYNKIDVIVLLHFCRWQMLIFHLELVFIRNKLRILLQVSSMNPRTYDDAEFWRNNFAKFMIPQTFRSIPCVLVVNRSAEYLLKFLQTVPQRSLTEMKFAGEFESIFHRNIFFQKLLFMH